MVDYKKEIRKLKKHRRLYRPAMARMLDLYNSVKPAELPVELIDDGDILTILELIDVGYLDESALVATRRFGTVTGLSFQGGHPFTGSGKAFYFKDRTIVHRVIDTLRGRRD